MKIRILSTSDVHGFVYPTNYQTKDNTSPVGMLKAGEVIKQAKEHAKPDEIVISIENGDWIQGSPLTHYLATKEESKAGYLSALTSNVGYDAATLGNHEFNYGLDYLKSAEGNRNYPILNANIPGLNQLGIADHPYLIMQKKGIKIAVLGLTTAYIPNWEQAKNIAGLSFNSAFTTAKEYVPKLKQLADVVIVAYHGGIERDPQTGQATEKATGENEGYRMMDEIPGINAMITGHQHRKLAGKINGVPFTQPGVHGEQVGEIDLELNDQKRITKSDAQLIATSSIEPAYSLLPDKALEGKVQSWLDEPIAKHTGASMKITNPLSARLSGNAYLNFINQVQMAETDCDISGTALFSDDIKGYDTDISMRDVLNSYPFPNVCVKEEITGLELKQALEQCAGFFELKDGKPKIKEKFITPNFQLFNYDVYNGIDYQFNLQKPEGHRLTKLSYHGQPVRDSQKLDVAINNYRAVGGGNYSMFNSSKIKYESPNPMSDSIINFLQRHSPYHAVVPDNFSINF